MSGYLAKTGGRSRGISPMPRIYTSHARTASTPLSSSCISWPWRPRDLRPVTFSMTFRGAPRSSRLVINTARTTGSSPPAGPSARWPGAGLHPSRVRLVTEAGAQPSGGPCCQSRTRGDLLSVTQDGGPLRRTAVNRRRRAARHRPGQQAVLCSEPRGSVPGSSRGAQSPRALAWRSVTSQRSRSRCRQKSSIVVSRVTPLAHARVSVPDSV